jgi:hypothetical protein
MLSSSVADIDAEHATQLITTCLCLQLRLLCNAERLLLLIIEPRIVRDMLIMHLAKSAYDCVFMQGDCISVAIGQTADLTRDIRDTRIAKSGIRLVFTSRKVPCLPKLHS